MRNKKKIRGNRDKKKDKDLLSLIDDYMVYFEVGIRVIYSIFIIFMALNIVADQQGNEIYQKYVKKSLIKGRKTIDYFFPGFLPSDIVFKIFDYDVLFIKTKEISYVIGYLFIFGAALKMGNLKFCNFLLTLFFIMDIILVHNLIYIRELGYNFDFIRAVLLFIFLYLI